MADTPRNPADPEWERFDRPAIEALQLERVQRLLQEILPTNDFYRRKLSAVDVLRSWDDFRALPLATKAEIADDQAAHPPYGTNLTYTLDRYIRLHQTSGTTGRAPIRWLDTEESWAWWARCWSHVYRGADVGPGDTVYFAFSFGPFIGFWSALEGARAVGALAVPGGGLTTDQRLQSIVESGATVLVCTPTYALRLAEAASVAGIDLRSCAVRATIHAGEPGASIPQTRDRIEDAWGARCYDHTGMTEVGATGFTCREQAGVHLIESEFIFEVLDPTTGQQVATGGQGELVVTNLGREGMPLIRYRTGDLVRVDPTPCRCGRTFARMVGGILGRADEMLVVRGVNVFPSAIEGVVREFPEVAEFRIEVLRVREMQELRLVVEPVADLGELAVDALIERLARTLASRLLLRVPCTTVAPGTLPRFELKARRVVHVG